MRFSCRLLFASILQDASLGANFSLGKMATLGWWLIANVGTEERRDEVRAVVESLDDLRWLCDDMLSEHLNLHTRAFNQPLNNWDVSNVNSMAGMFDSAISFNQPLNNWNVSKVTYMGVLFDGASSFNQPLNNWNVSNVNTMEGMFWGATSFNQPLNNWNVSNVTSMDYMFASTRALEAAPAPAPLRP